MSAPVPLLQPVDHLEVQILVDNVSDSVSSGPAFVETEFAHHYRHGMQVLAGPCLCCATHGLSCLVTLRRGAQRRTVLFDTGPDEEVFRRNVARLQVDLGRVDAIVISHGHWDHAGALFAALQLIRAGRGDVRVPIHMHPDMFHTRAMRSSSGAMQPFADVPGIEALRAAGGDVVLARQPEALFDGWLQVSGEIPRLSSFERGMPGQYRRIDGGDWEPDPLIMDERWLAVRVRDAGLVAMTACSHAGVVNVLLHARANFPGVPLRCVLGGLHLAGENEDIIPQTVQALREFTVASIAAGHCTGWRAMTALANAFGDQVLVPLAVGKTLRFGRND